MNNINKDMLIFPQTQDNHTQERPGFEIERFARVLLNHTFQFAYPSPRQRVYLIDTPASFLCDTATGELTRYSGYTIASNQSDRDSSVELLSAGASDSILSNNLSACTFTYTPGTAQRAALITLSLTLTQDGESISLLQQVHVDNVP